MTKPAPELAELQRWMQAVITHESGVATALDSADARQHIDIGADGVEAVVTRSNAQTSVERLAIYGNAYFARLLECLREFFPALTHALGEEVFDQFALEYLHRYPSTSYTLEHLADRFPSFLRETKPEDKVELSWPDFLVDLAELELAIGRVFDGPGPEKLPRLTSERLAAVPAEVWPAARLVPVPCLRLLEFAWPVSDYYTAFRDGEAPTIPHPESTYLALTRRDYVVHRLPLSAEQHTLLSALLEGETIDTAIERCAEHSDDLEQLAANLSAWFRDWASAELFLDVRLP